MERELSRESPPGGQTRVVPPLADQLDLHRGMLRIRQFEETVSRLYRDAEIPGFVHLSIGQEAVSSGCCSVLRPTDAIVSTHRGHGHCLAKGASMTGMFAELLGKATGTCGGLGGSMHIAEFGVGVYGANGIVGAGLPIANGIATAFRQLHRDDVVVAFFGEGAAAQGVFHESLNLASVWHLPVLFMCENNGYAEFSRFEMQQSSTPAERAAAYRIPAKVIDGNDVLTVRAAVDEDVSALRAGHGPRLIEAITYRWHGHYEGDPERYRDQNETELWRQRDPIILSAARLREGGGDGAIPSIESEVEAEVSQSLSRARQGAPASLTSALEAVDAPVEIPSSTERLDEGSVEYRYMDALREALIVECERDPSVWLAGVDIGAGGGVFGITKPVAERFPERVLDTPISEAAVIGLAVGGAMAATHPIVELMYGDFLGVCFDQILNQAAKLHFMTGGEAQMSLVIRTQFGAGRSSGPQHSQSLESLLTQIPGLKVVMPAFPADAYGLLRSSIRDPNPVVFIEHRLLYGLKGHKPEPDHIVPIGRARVVRPGKHVTIVSWSRMLHEAIEAATAVAPEGIEAEVIDLRTVAPIDKETIADSLSRTHRLLIAHEAVFSTGIGAEIGAWVSDELFWELDAPIRRVAPPFSPVPYSREAESAWLPNKVAIANAIRSLVNI